MRALYLSELEAYLRYYDLPGDEPARMYLHGLGRSSAAFIHIAADPALAGHRSLLVDFLGFGLSDKPESFTYTLEAHAGTLARVLDHLGLRGCQIIGHSLGGSVAVLLADLRPELVSRLVLAEANLDPGAGPMSGAIVQQSEASYVAHGFESDLARLQERARSGTDSVPPVVLGMQQVTAPHAMYRTARSLVEGPRPTIRERLLRMNLPRVFLVGSRTLQAEPKPASGEAGEGLAAAGVPVLVVRDAGHPMMFQNPSGFAQCIAEALGAGTP